MIFKSIVLKGLLCTALVASMVSCTDDDGQNQDGQIVTNVCEPIKNYVATHFPNSTIRKVERDIENGRVEFDVYLSDQTELEFFEDCTVHEVESRNGLPASVVPAAITADASTRFPGAVIVKWELYPTYQEIQLANGVEVEYTLDGAFIRIDD